MICVAVRQSSGLGDNDDGRLSHSPAFCHCLGRNSRHGHRKGWGRYTCPVEPLDTRPGTAGAGGVCRRTAAALFPFSFFQLLPSPSRTCRFPHRRRPIRSTPGFHRSEDFSLHRRWPSRLRAASCPLRFSPAIASLPRTQSSPGKKDFFRPCRFLRYRIAVHMRGYPSIQLPPNSEKNPHGLARDFFFPSNLFPRSPQILIRNSHPRVFSFQSLF